MLDKIIYFTVDYILGFLFQAAGISLCIFAYTRARLDKMKFTAMTFSIAVVSVLVRFAKDPLGAAFVVICASLSFILITLLLLKQNFLSSAVAALISYGSVMVLEVIFGAVIWPLVLGKETAKEIFLNQEALDFKLLGLPINLVLIILGFIFYLVLKRENHGKDV